MIIASEDAIMTEGLVEFIADALGKTAVGTGGVVGGNKSFNGGQTFTGGAGEGKRGEGLFGGVGLTMFLAAVGGEVNWWCG